MLQSSWLLPVLVVLGMLGAFVVVWAVRRRLHTGPGAAATAAPVPGDRLRRGLAAAGRRLMEQVDAALGRAPAGLEAVLSDLEEALVSADVGVRTAKVLLDRVRQRVGPAGGAAEVRQALREEMVALLDAPPPPAPAARPWVVLVTGVNGVGKTTTIGKLGARHAEAGQRVLFVAGDTFRAAAVDQLAIWAERSGAALVRQAPGADPSAVVFDGMKAAVARAIDVVFVDTAGRLHTRTNLMAELGKVRRVIAREAPGAPHETLLVLDATTGQNAIAQARSFLEAADVTGIVLTKLDGTARGGIVLAVRHELGIPIHYVGVGESVDDLRPFIASEFVDALFAVDTAESARVA